MIARVVVALLGLAAPVANPAAVEAEAAFAAGDYARAIEALDRAYAVDPDPNFVFAKGSAFQKLGRCPEAIAAYAVFLASEPAPDQARTTAERIRECSGRTPIAALDPPPPPAPRLAVAPPPEPTPIVDTPAVDRRWRRDPLALGLIGTGAGLGVAAGVLAGIGARLDRRAAGQPTEGEFRSDVHDARALGISAIAIASAAGVAVLAGIIRYGVLGRRSSRRTAPRSGIALRW